MAVNVKDMGGEAMALKAKQLQAIALMIDEDMNNIEVAERLGIHVNTVTLWLKNEEFQAELHSQIQKKFDKLALVAQRELVRLLDSCKSENVKLKVIQDILDRAGFKAIEHSEIDYKDVSFEIDYGNE